MRGGGGGNEGGMRLQSLIEVKTVPNNIFSTDCLLIMSHGPGQSRTGVGMAGHGKTGHSRAGQGRVGKGRAG